MAPGHSSIREVAKVRSKTPGEGENVMGTEKNQKSVGTTLPLVCVGHCATNFPGTFWDYISQGGSLSVIPGCLYFGICLLTEYTACCYETAPNQGNKV